MAGLKLACLLAALVCAAAQPLPLPADPEGACTRARLLEVTSAVPSCAGTISTGQPAGGQARRSSWPAPSAGVDRVDRRAYYHWRRCVHRQRPTPALLRPCPPCRLPQLPTAALRWRRPMAQTPPRHPPTASACLGTGHACQSCRPRVEFSCPSIWTPASGWRAVRPLCAGSTVEHDALVPPLLPCATRLCRGTAYQLLSSATQPRLPALSSVRSISMHVDARPPSWMP